MFPSPYTGGQIRYLQFFNWLSQRHEVHFLAVARKAESPYLEFLRSKGHFWGWEDFQEWLTRQSCKIPRHPAERIISLTSKMLHALKQATSPLPLAAFQNSIPYFPDFVDHLAARYHYDIVQVYWFGLAELVNLPFRGAKAVLDCDDLYHAWNITHIGLENNIIKRSRLQWDQHKVICYEQSIVPLFHSCLADSDKDADYVRGIGGRILAIVPQGCNPELLELDPAEYHLSQTPSVVTVGALSTMRNEAGAWWLVTQVWPKVLLSVPDAELWIVGANPSERLLRYAGDNPSVHLPGFVENVIEPLSRAWVSVVPTVAGIGVKTKVIESMAMAKPVVTTELGAENIELVHNSNAYVARSADDFAGGLVGLLTDAERRNMMERRARETANRLYRWPDILNRLERAYVRFVEQP